jgi:hypothetical protein
MKSRVRTLIAVLPRLAWGRGRWSVIYPMVEAWYGHLFCLPWHRLLSCELLAFPAAGLYSILVLKTPSSHKIMSGKQGSVLYRYGSCQLMPSPSVRHRDCSVERLLSEANPIWLASSKIPKYWTPPPTPLTARRVCTPLVWGGEDTLARRIGGWGVNILEDVRHSSVLYIRKYFVDCSSWQACIQVQTMDLLTT